MSTNFLFSKVCWQCPAMCCLYTSSKIFTEGEGDGIESRIPFKIFSTSPNMAYFAQNSNSAIDNSNIIAVQVERGFPLMGHTGAARAAVQNLTK